MILTLLNVPNFYVSFYLLGLSDYSEIKFDENDEFKSFNYRPIAIFRINNKIFVIDNTDPTGIDPHLLACSKAYFATNKLIGDSVYEQENVEALFPHYPINFAFPYFKIFWRKLASKDGKNTLKEIFRMSERDLFEDKEEKLVEGNPLFFAGSIWKNEMEANQIRYSFIKACQQNPRLDFQGGFIPRDDGNNLGFDDALAPRKFPPCEFMRMSQKSIFGFNNAAVRGAISWRVAEYLNLGVPILSLPFKIELPITPLHRSQIHMIDDVSETPDFIEFALDNPSYLNDLAKGGKEYFKTYCLPKKQANMILTTIK